MVSMTVCHLQLDTAVLLLRFDLAVCLIYQINSFRLRLSQQLAVCVCLALDDLDVIQLLVYRLGYIEHHSTLHHRYTPPMSSPSRRISAICVSCPRRYFAQILQASLIKWAKSAVAIAVKCIKLFGINDVAKAVATRKERLVKRYVSNSRPLM